MPVTTNTRKLAALLGASGAGIGTDGLMQPAGIDADMATQVELDAADNKITTNLAVLAIRQAADHNDVKYSLQDRIIDDYYDASGIDVTPSNNHIFATGVYRGEGVITPTVTHGADATGVDGDYTWYKWTTVGSETYQNDTAQDTDYIVVAGGGGGGGHAGGGGGGAGGFRTATALAAGTGSLTVTVGAGGTSSNSSTDNATDGGNSVFGTITATGGGKGQYNHAGGSGGSGGGAGTGPTPTAWAGGGSTAYGNDGAASIAGLGTGSEYTGAGGGGAGGVGATNASVAVAGAGGVGENNVMGLNDADSDAFLTTVSAGHDVGGTRYFAGGGGGGSNQTTSTAGAGGTGGGADGKSNSAVTADAGLANTGGGGGGGGGVIGSTSGAGGAGGTGIVIIRRKTTITTGAPDDFILQSTDTEAEAQPTKADMVMLVEDAGSGVGVVQTHIKGWISRDSGTTFTQGTLVDEGDWGTDKRILAFHDLDISAQPADKTMCYKITTHSASAVYDTRIHATSMGWS